MRIRECTCPKCGKNDFEYEGVGFDMGHHTDSNTYDVDYIVLCDCGCTFMYTEKFSLKETLIKKFHD